MKTCRIVSISFLFYFLLTGCKHFSHTVPIAVPDERSKVVSFLCNNADSIAVFTLKKTQCGDSIYVNNFDSITDEHLKALIVTNYLNSRLRNKMFRDSLNCEGQGAKHKYSLSLNNIYSSKLTTVKDYSSFLANSKPNDVYFVICRPLTIDDNRYYLVSLEQKNSNYLERLWVKVANNGCIKEIADELSIQ